MFFIAGLAPRIKQLGFVQGRCPVCRDEVDLHLIRQSQTVSLFFVPLIPIGGQHLATCPHCASISEVDRSAGKAFESGRLSRLEPEQMRVVQNNRGLFCPACRARVEHGQNFCPNCGERL